MGADYVFLGSYRDVDMAIAEARRRSATTGGECVVHVASKPPGGPTLTGS